MALKRKDSLSAQTAPRQSIIYGARKLDRILELCKPKVQSEATENSICESTILLTIRDYK